RIIDVPPARTEDLPATIEEEFERIVGASVAEYYLSWQRLPGRIRQRRVFVLAVPRTTIESTLEALDVAGIRPYTMDLRPLGIALAERLRAATRHPMGRLATPLPAPPEFPTVDYLVNLGLALKQS